MTAEQPTSEAPQPASGDVGGEPYTHLTVTFREPLATVQPITGTLTLELDDPVWPDDVGEEGHVPADNIWDVYKAIDQAFVDAGRQSTIRDFQSGDVYVIAWMNENYVIVLESTYYSDGFAYLVDVDWISEWRLHRA